MADEKKCEELRRAREDAHARLSVPKVGAALTSGVAPHDLDLPEHETEVDAQVWQEIRNIERAMREAGCE